MRIPAASSTAIRTGTAGRPQAAQWLGAGDAALRFATTHRLATTQQSPTVFAVLSHDAVRLPCGLVLATTTAELPLTSISAVCEVHGREDAVVGDARVEWTRPDGRVTAVAARHWPQLAGGDSPPQELALSIPSTAPARGIPTGLGRDMVSRRPASALASATLGSAAITASMPLP